MILVINESITIPACPSTALGLLAIPVAFERTPDLGSTEGSAGEPQLTWVPSNTVGSRPSIAAMATKSGPPGATEQGHVRTTLMVCRVLTSLRRSFCSGSLRSTLSQLCYSITRGRSAPTLKLQRLHPSQTVCNNCLLLQGLWDGSPWACRRQPDGLTVIFLFFNRRYLSADMTSWSNRGFLEAPGMLLALQRGLKTISIATKCGNFPTSNQLKCAMKPTWCCGQSGFAWFLKQPHLCAWILKSRRDVFFWRALSAARLRACLRARLLSAGAPRISECGMTHGIRARTRSGKRTWIPHACVSLSPARRAETDCRFSDFRPVRCARGGHTSI